MKFMSTMAVIERTLILGYSNLLFAMSNFRIYKCQQLIPSVTHEGVHHIVQIHKLPSSL